MPEGASISGGARWPAASPPPEIPPAPSLPTSFADEETEVQSAHLPLVTQDPEGLLFIFFESICLNK